MDIATIPTDILKARVNTINGILKARVNTINGILNYSTASHISSRRNLLAALARIELELSNRWEAYCESKSDPYDHAHGLDKD